MAHGSAGIDRPAALDRCLSTLLMSYTGIEAAAVVSYDGLPIASSLPAPMDENRVAGILAHDAESASTPAAPGAQLVSTAPSTPTAPVIPLPARTAPWSSYAPVGAVGPGEPATRP